MERHDLKSSFTLENTPDWICPTCGKAPLRIQEGSFVKEERRISRDHSPPVWEPAWIDYVYSCLLVCSNDKCKEVVASSGTGSVESRDYVDQDGVGDQEYLNVFRPRFFEPHLILFQIPKGCPKPVIKPLRESFSLFFCAPHAALSNVRIAIEALLTELKIKRFHVAEGTRRYISLHQRIGLLPMRYAALKESILAIKWLGNAGSHEGSAVVTMDNVIDAYELTEHILQEVYARKSANIRKLAKKVNKTKGPRK